MPHEQEQQAHVTYGEEVRRLHEHLLERTPYARYVEDATGEALIKARAEYMLDAGGIGDQQLTDNEYRFITWMAGWDKWTIEMAGSVLLRARAAATARLLCAPEIMAAELPGEDA